MNTPGADETEDSYCKLSRSHALTLGSPINGHPKSKRQNVIANSNRHISRCLRFGDLIADGMLGYHSQQNDSLCFRKTSYHPKMATSSSPPYTADHPTLVSYSIATSYDKMPDIP